MLKTIGPLELVIILLIVIAVFGAGKIASLGGALGRGVRDFRKELKGSGGDSEEEMAADQGSDIEGNDEA